MIRAPRVALAVALGLLLAPPASPGPAGDGCRVIDDFRGDRVGEFPREWTPRKDEGRGVYSVQEEGGLRFLRAVSRGLGIQAARAFAWDLEAYPVLAWSWRPRQFPRGADEKDGKNDSVLAVYMLVPHSRVAGPRAVKYIWSERVPAGTRLESNHGLTRVIVLRDGAGRKGEWVEERVNVRDDYLRLFEERRVPRPAGIAVLTDADDTDSTAAGDYTGFRVCPR